MNYLQNGVEAYVRTRSEHPPPHVHISHDADKWEIKIEFSYVENLPSTYRCIYLTKKKPTVAQVNFFKAEVANSRQECREKWNQYVGKLDLKNKYVVIAQGVANSATAATVGAFLVTSAIYDPNNDNVNFNNGTFGQCP